jgi:hypothetical protein
MKNVAFRQLATADHEECRFYLVLYSPENKTSRALRDNSPTVLKIHEKRRFGP